MKPLQLTALAAGLFVTGAIALPALADDAKSTPAATAGPKSAPGSAPAKATNAAQDPRDRRIDELTQIVGELRKRVEELEQRSATAPAPPPAAAPAAPAPPADAAQAPPPAAEPSVSEAPSGGSATLLPNISAIGNVIFRGSNSKHTEGRGHFNLDEAELAFQDRVAPNLRADFFFSADKGNSDWITSVEEGYLTWVTPLGLPNLSADLGGSGTPFGKINPQHTHLRRTIDQPSVITAFMRQDGLAADGSVFQYLLPFKISSPTSSSGAGRRPR